MAVSLALNWILFLGLFPIAFYWLRRAWRILIKRDFSEVALKYGEAPPNAGVYIHDTTFEAWNMLQRDGRLRQDLRPVWQVGEGEFAIVHHELHMNEADYQIWTAYQSPATAHVLTYDGVPIVSVYRNPRGR